MAEKKAFVLRINPDMLKEVEAWAADEFRSTNGQIEYLLQEALKARKSARKKKLDK
ncbi:Arc family DNA binding domain-containing protein [Mucilaginibacter terrenus]|uniref:Arc family DNA binding domain-containing protein n=1 Tax=Mucilaginibacter terrenus TaxID=2482727 RepID=A0A3E2NW83_9SPHI|nr:Arc family DNA binding domain-containing protein [Mucilaginibacter terrenus]RFZ85276.1 Arc family DNA binding domain-containing protein [Mucilaginibacter terrenus]